MIDRPGIAIWESKSVATRVCQLLDCAEHRVIKSHTSGRSLLKTVKGDQLERGNFASKSTLAYRADGSRKNNANWLALVRLEETVEDVPD
jgi:hypothetical protein